MVVQWGTLSQRSGIKGPRCGYYSCSSLSLSSSPLLMGSSWSGCSSLSTSSRWVRRWSVAEAHLPNHSTMASSSSHVAAVATKTTPIIDGLSLISPISNKTKQGTFVVIIPTTARSNTTTTRKTSTTETIPLPRRLIVSIEADEKEGGSGRKLLKQEETSDSIQNFLATNPPRLRQVVVPRTNSDTISSSHAVASSLKSQHAMSYGKGLLSERHRYSHCHQKRWMSTIYPGDSRWKQRRKQHRDSLGQPILIEPAPVPAVSTTTPSSVRRGARRKPLVDQPSSSLPKGKRGDLQGGGIRSEEEQAAAGGSNGSTSTVDQQEKQALVTGTMEVKKNEQERMDDNNDDSNKKKKISKRKKKPRDSRWRDSIAQMNPHIASALSWSLRTEQRPILNASAVLCGKEYCKRSATAQTSRSGTAAAQRLLKGKRDFMEHLRRIVHGNTLKNTESDRTTSTNAFSSWNTDELNYHRYANPSIQFVLQGHGIPTQLLQDHVDLADAVLQQYQNTAWCSFYLSPNHDEVPAKPLDGVRQSSWKTSIIRLGNVQGDSHNDSWPPVRGISSVLPDNGISSPSPSFDWEERMQLYLIVMHRLVSHLGHSILVIPESTDAEKYSMSSFDLEGDESEWDTSDVDPKPSGDSRIDSGLDSHDTNLTAEDTPSSATTTTNATTTTTTTTTTPANLLHFWNITFARKYGDDADLEEYLRDDEPLRLLVQWNPITRGAAAPGRFRVILQGMPKENDRAVILTVDANFRRREITGLD